MQPKLKDGISVLVRKQNRHYEVNFLLNASGGVRAYQFTDAAVACLRLMNGANSIKRIASLTNLPADHVASVVTFLKTARLLDSTSQQSNKKAPRFETQLNFFADYESDAIHRSEMQACIERATVLIIGLGGIGSWVAYGLTLAGVQNFILVDPDSISISNLNRQCLFNASHLGQAKVAVMARLLAEVNQKGNIQTYQCLVEDKKFCDRVSQSADLVINCADKPEPSEVNRMVTYACFRHNIPHILCGGYDGHLSFLGPTVLPGKSACWYCYEKSLVKQFAHSGYEHLLVTPCHLRGGNLSAISAITANFHVLEAIKVLSGFAAPSMLNKAAELNFLTYDIHFRHYQRVRNCQHCKRHDNADRQKH